MKTIYRYDAAIKDCIRIELPGADACIIHVAPSDRINNGIALWAIVDTSEQTWPHFVYVRGTGHELGTAEDKQHIGTVNIAGTMWFHVFSGEVQT
jgi:hypothetical protein